jgi:hypothetical protein
MRQSSDRAPLLARKVHTAEQEFARTKNIRDLTDVVKYAAQSKNLIKSLKVEPEKKKGIPIGQRWN